MDVRAVLTAALLVFVLLPGCGNPAKPHLIETEPAEGYEAALAQAAAVAPAPRLVNVFGVERVTGKADLPPDDFYNQIAESIDAAPGDGKASVWVWQFQAAGTGIEVLTSSDRVVDHRTTESKPIEGFDFKRVLGPSVFAGKMDDQYPGWRDGTRAVRWTLSLPVGEPVDPYWVVTSLVPEGPATAAFNGVTGELEVDLVPDSIVAAPTLQLSDCTNFGGVFPVPMADATAALPTGFTPVESPNDPAGGATLYILFLTCEGSKVDGNDTGPTTVAYAELAVVPPDEYKLPGITDYTVPLAIGAGSNAVGDRLALFMLGHAGPSTVTDVTDGAPGPQKARMVVDGITIDLTGQFSPGAASAILDGGFALIGVQDGAVRSVIQASSHGGSAIEGTVTQQSMGLPIFTNARPLALGFSVSGFTLDFVLAKTV